MKLFSPAKVNLFLRVTGKREDGFHELSSLFQTIDLGDHLTFTPASADHFTTDAPSLPLDERNLVVRALQLFKKQTGSTQTFHIHLEKQIPQEAGLGGGSSNGATTLWGLNALHDFPLDLPTLMHLAEQLGSDVPFFFSHGTAHVTGRGERVQNLPPLPQEKPLWLIKPEEGLSTKEIYSRLKLSTCSQADRLFHNDLETPAFEAKPSLKELKKKLDHLYDRVVMTGSGTAFVCEGEHQQGRPIAFIQRQTSSLWYQQSSCDR